ncbi:MAG: multiheme c-type cytochrome [Prolixibacteraceae bacterium]|nr:multiheme c-type cytochrome [Prolixibacteraceae bacterium]
MRNSVLYILLLLLAGSVSGQDKVTLKAQSKNQKKEYHYFENPQVCAGCHWDKFERWNVSQHSKGFTGDFFQKQFYELVLPSESFAPEVKDVKDGCIGCHAPASFLAGDMVPPETVEYDNHWNRGDGYKTMADRGIFCDFCHTISHFKNDPPFNHDYVSTATEAVDTKFGDLEFPWSPHHETATSEIFEDPMMCSTCHNELNPYDVWVKATFTEYEESIYPFRGVACQTCHMQTMGGQPAKMGLIRPHNSDHWLGGGFTGFVEGAATITVHLDKTEFNTGEEVSFSVDVQAVATGHKFPTGSTEERDVWLRLSLVDHKGNELLHIPVPENPSDPSDKYFITSNETVGYPSHSKLSEPVSRDALPEGDRIYHSAFLDSEGKFTYAQWFCVKEIENRLAPLEVREENYNFIIPDNLRGELYLQAKMNYRRMPDSLADYLGIDRRPVIQVAKDIRKIKIN